MSPVHIHLILNHVPPIGVPIGVALLAWALLRRDRSLARAAMALFVAMSLAIVPVYLTGEGAEEVAEGLPGVTHDVVEAHEEAATVGLGLTLLLGVAALGGLFAMRGERPLSRPVGIGVLAVGIASAGALTWVAGLGGQIRHTEIRSGAPVGDDEREEEGGGGRGRGRGRGGRE